MRAAIITCPRPHGVSYIDATIKSLRQGGRGPAAFDMRIFVDALDGPTRIQGIECEYSTPERMARHKVCEPIGSMNFARAARWVGKDGDGCVFEDDVQAAEMWLPRASELAHMANDRGEDWVLALTHFYVFGDFWMIEERCHADIRLLKWQQPHIFYGAQAIMLSKVAALDIASQIDEAYSQDDRSVWCKYLGDTAIKTYCVDKKVPMYSCSPCLFQHTGHVSTFANDRLPLLSREYRSKVIVA